jgi:hypothetical protein
MVFSPTEPVSSAWGSVVPAHSVRSSAAYLNLSSTSDPSGRCPPPAWVFAVDELPPEHPVIETSKPMMTRIQSAIVAQGIFDPSTM